MGESNKIRFAFLRFLFSKVFYKNLGIALLVFIILIVSLIIFLRQYTKYKDEIVLPNFVGENVSILADSSAYENFNFEVIDSVFGDIQRGGEIIRQSPSPGLNVKKGRVIYFTIIASTPEKVIMPDLKYLTLRHAISLIKQAKLEVGKLDYTPNFAKNAILGQYYKGDTVFPGDTLIVSSKIDLLVGTGQGNVDIPIPFLIGLKRSDAINELTASSFNLGREFYMDSIKDEHATVYMQNPMIDSDKLFFPGDSINLWYRSDQLINFEEYIAYINDSLNPDTLFIDTLNVNSIQKDEF